MPNLQLAVKAIAFLSVALLGMACAMPPGANITTVVPATPIKPVSDAATIVVIQPTTRYVFVSLLDKNGQVLGQIQDRSHAVFTVPPGEFTLYAAWDWQGKTSDRIRGVVSAGRVYFATISLRYGGIRLNSLNRGSPDSRWPKRVEWLARTQRLEMNRDDIQHVDTWLRDKYEIMREIDELVDAFPPDQIAVRTIRPEDGLTEDEVE